MTAEKAARTDALESEVADLKARNADADERIERLTQILKAFDRARFGRRSEKLGSAGIDDEQQAFVFEEIETGIAAIRALVNKGAAHTEKRPPRPRKGFAPHLERVEVVIEPDGLEFTCWNGEVIRLAFIIDAFDREIIAWTAVANAGISGSDVRDMMLEAVEKRFAATRAPHAIEHLSDNGSAYTARDTRLFAQALNLTPCFTPVASPQSNGMSEAFVKTLKRDYIRISALPDAQTALRLIDGWIEDLYEGVSVKQSFASPSNS